MYYNPQEEERKEREQRIKSELTPGLADGQLYKSRIAGSFQSVRKKHAAQAVSGNVAIMRTLILLALVLLVIGYLQFGNDVVYGLFVLVPLWLFMKLKGLKKSSE
jgi:hypothetical protein